MNKKQTVFVNEYLTCWNAAEAARRAGYSVKTARSYGQQLLTNLDIKEEIQARLAEKQMSADEALTLLADMARGDVAQLMDVSSMGFSLDMQRAKELGLTKLIKKVKQRTIIHQGKSESDEDRETHDLEIELYDAQSALDKILRVAGRYKDVGTQENPLIIESSQNDERFDRAMSTLSETIRESISGQGTEQDGSLVSTE